MTFESKTVLLLCVMLTGSFLMRVTDSQSRGRPWFPPTSFHEAVIRGDAETVKTMLLENPGWVDWAYGYGNAFPLQDACRHSDALAFFLDRGLSANQVRMKAKGITLLHQAIRVLWF